jgi:hypothetical protein
MLQLYTIYRTWGNSSIRMVNVRRIYVLLASCSPLMLDQRFYIFESFSWKRRKNIYRAREEGAETLGKLVLPSSNHFMWPSPALMCNTRTNSLPLVLLDCCLYINQKDGSFGQQLPIFLFDGLNTAQQNNLSRQLFRISYFCLCPQTAIRAARFKNCVRTLCDSFLIYCYGHI